MADVTYITGMGNEVVLTLFCGVLILLIVLVGALFRMSSQETSVARRRAFSSQDRCYNSSTTGNDSSNNNSSDVCPICISPHVLAVETNCGHKLCGSCFRSYLNHRTSDGVSMFRGRLSCPLCRQNINILLISFTREEMRSPSLDEERRSVEEAVHDYNVRYGSGPRSMWSNIRDCPVLIRHLLMNFFSLGGVLFMFRLQVIICFLAAVVYLGNPIDFIPEAIFGIFGFLDDVIVFILSAVYVSVIYRRIVISRGRQSQ